MIEFNPGKARRLKTALLASAFGFLAAGSAVSQTVTLESFDQTVRLTGELIEFDGKNYRIRNMIGEVVIDAQRVSCIGESCPVIEEVSNEFVISGSNVLATRLIPALVEGYGIALDADMLMAVGADNQTQIALNDADGEEIAKVSLAGNGSSAGLRDIYDRNAALAVTTRPVSSGEVQALEQAGLGNFTEPGRENILALDGLLVVTSPDNPVRALSEEDVARVFSGQVVNWSQLGGYDAPINLHIRADDTGTGFVFNELVMRPAQLSIASAATVHATDAEVSDAVTQDPNGIGFTSYSNTRNAKSLAIRGVCGIQTPATAFTIQTEEYPLTRRLYLYKPNIPMAESAENFVAYTQTPEAQQIIRSAGFVDQDVSAVSVNEQGLRFVSAVLPTDAEASLEELRGMMSDLVAADRLSITFRFESGTARLDSRAQADVNRLASMIANGELDRKEVILVGFTDSVGRGDLNTRLSEARAAQVREALLAALPPGAENLAPISVRGYGEISPLGCNETGSGRRINRRVEVWVRDIIGGAS